VQKQLLSAILIICGAIALSGWALAATINSTTVLGSQVTIGGTGFTGSLSVTLNNQKLAIASSTSTKIVATMNPVFAAGSYRLVLKTGSTSTTGTVTIPPSSVVVAQCAEASANGTTQIYTVYLLGGEPCDQGSAYPPYAGVPFPAGMLSNLRVKGQFSGITTLYVNSNPTALSCTVTDNNGYESYCNDLVDQVVINAGDELNLGITPTVVGTITLARVTFEFQGQ
jgi:hypothetical protein